MTEENDVSNLDLEAQLSQLEEELIEKLHEVEGDAHKSSESILSDEFGKVLYLPQLLRPLDERSSKLILDEMKYSKYTPETVPNIDPNAPPPLLKKLSSEEIIAKTHEFQRNRRISKLSNISIPSIEQKLYASDLGVHSFLHNDYSKLEHLEQKLEQVLKFNIISDLIKEIEETIEEKVDSVLDETAIEEEESSEEFKEQVAEPVVGQKLEMIPEEPEKEIEISPQFFEEIPEEPSPQIIEEVPEEPEKEAEVSPQFIEETPEEPEKEIEISPETMEEIPGESEKGIEVPEAIEVPLEKEVQLQIPIEEEAVEIIPKEPVLEKIEEPKKIESLKKYEIPKVKPKTTRKSIGIPLHKTSEQLVIDGFIIKHPKMRDEKILSKKSSSLVYELKRKSIEPPTTEPADQGRFLFTRDADYKEWSSEDFLKDIRTNLIKAKEESKEPVRQKSILHTGERSSSTKTVSFEEIVSEEKAESPGISLESSAHRLRSTPTQEELDISNQYPELKEVPKEVELTRKKKVLCFCDKKKAVPKEIIRKPAAKTEQKKAVCFCSPEKISTTKLCNIVKPVKESKETECLCELPIENCTPINTEDLEDDCLCSSKPFTEKLLSKFGIKRYPRKEIVDPPPLVRHLEKALGIICPRIQLKHYPPLNSCSDQPLCEKIINTIGQQPSSCLSLRNCTYDQLRIHLEPPFGCQCNIEAFSFSSSSRRSSSPCELQSNTTQTSEDIKGAYFLTEDDISVCMNDETRSYLGDNIKVSKAVVRFVKGRPRIALQINLNENFNESAWYSVDTSAIEEEGTQNNDISQLSEKMIHVQKKPHHSIVDPVFKSLLEKQMEEEEKAEEDADSNDEIIGLKTTIPLTDLHSRLNTESLTPRNLSANLIGNFPTVCKPTEKFTLSVCTDRATTTSPCVKTKTCLQKFLKPLTNQQKLRPKRVVNESCICSNFSVNELKDFGDIRNLKPPCHHNINNCRLISDSICLQKSDTSIIAPKCIQKLSKCRKMNGEDNNPPVPNFNSISHVDSLDTTLQKFKEKQQDEEREDAIPKIDPVQPKRNSILKNSFSRFSSIASILKHPNDSRNKMNSTFSMRSVHFDTMYPIRNTAKKLSSGNISFPRTSTDTEKTENSEKESNDVKEKLEDPEGDEESKPLFKLRVDQSSGHIFVHKTSDESLNSKEVAVGDLDSLLEVGKTLTNTIQNTVSVDAKENIVLCDNCGGYKPADVSICTREEVGTSDNCRSFNETEEIIVDKTQLKELDQQLHQLLNSSIKCRCGCDFDIPYRNFVAARGLLNNGKKSRLSRCLKVIKSMFK